MGAPWCLGPIDAFEPNKVYPITIYNKQYALWKNCDDTICAVESTCKHMFADLTQGFIKNGCLACPLHGHLLQYSGNGEIFVEGKKKDNIQVRLPLTIKDGLIWTYGLKWVSEGNVSTAKKIEPKQDIPDYSDLIIPGVNKSEFYLSDYELVYQKSMLSPQNLWVPMANFHDAEHFRCTHRNSLYADQINIKNLKRENNQIFWELETIKSKTIKARFNITIPSVITQYFQSFLPSIGFQYVVLNGQPVISLITMYPYSKFSTMVHLFRFVPKDASSLFKFLQSNSGFGRFISEIFEEDAAIGDGIILQKETEISLRNDYLIKYASDFLYDF